MSSVKPADLGFKIKNKNQLLMPKTGSPEYFRDRLDEIRARLSMAQTAEAVWNQLLNEQDRAKLGPDLKSVVEKLRTWNAGALYQMAKGVSRDMATLEVATTLDFITTREYRVLRQYVETKEGRSIDRRNKSLSADGISFLDLIQRARVKNDLVVVVGEYVRAVYWQDGLCETRWEDCLKSWDFILKLAKGCEKGAHRSISDFGENITRHTISSKKYNLKRLELPIELIKSITIESSDSGVRDLVYLNLRSESVRVINVGRHLSSVDDLS